MSKLLRLANELIAARDKANMEEWGWHYRPGDKDAPASIHAKGSHISTAIAMCPRFGIDQFPHDAAFITITANHAVDIIKGYQELLRRVVDEWDGWAPDDDLFALIRVSIPQENTNE